MNGSTLKDGHVLQGFAPGTVCKCNKIGYMDIETFGDYLQHFDKHTRDDRGVRDDGTGVHSF